MISPKIHISVSTTQRMEANTHLPNPLSLFLPASERSSLSVGPQSPGRGPLQPQSLPSEALDCNARVTMTTGSGSALGWPDPEFFCWFVWLLFFEVVLFCFN